jgi:hypothetical protein
VALFFMDNARIVSSIAVLAFADRSQRIRRIK